jgi:hypothetical protein
MAGADATTRVGCVVAAMAGRVAGAVAGGGRNAAVLT